MNTSSQLIEVDRAQAKKMKPISNHAEILRLMREGWELGFSTTLSISSNGRARLQKGGLCCGGDVVRVHNSTLRSLIRKGLIRRNPKPEGKFWLTRYEINE